MCLRRGPIRPSTAYGPLVIELAPSDARAFIELALDRMMSRAAALGAHVDEPPDLPGSNSVYALVVHCVGVGEWWLDHVVLGRPSTRDRDAEFAASGTLEDLESLVAAFRSRLPVLLDQVAATLHPVSAHLETVTAPDRTWPWTTGSIVLHVVEELFQHAGHVDLTADLLTAGLDR